MSEKVSNQTGETIKNTGELPPTIDVREFFKRLKTRSLDDDIALAKEFYESDVIPRAKRERSWVDLYAYALPLFNTNVPIIIGEEDGSWYSDNVSGYYSPAKNEIRLNPSVDEKANTIVHEMAHANQEKYNHAAPLWQTILFPAASVVRNIIRQLDNKEHQSGYDYRKQIPKTEQEYLNKAYKVDSENAELKYSDTIAERHAVNRELRYLLWKQLRNQLGRNPTIDELDEYIKIIPDSQLEDHFIIKINGKEYISGYLLDYLNGGNNSYDIKSALQHVAQNDNQSNDLQYAKYGKKLNYTQFFK